MCVPHTLLCVMCLVIMAFVIKWHISMYGCTQHKHYDVRLIFWEPMLAKRPHSAGLCPAVPQSRSPAASVDFLHMCTAAYKLPHNVLWLALHILLCNVQYTIVCMYTNSFIRYCCLLGLYLLRFKIHKLLYNVLWLRLH